MWKSAHGSKCFKTTIHYGQNSEKIKCNNLEQSILFNNKGEGEILTNSISVICSQFTRHTQGMDKNNTEIQFNRKSMYIQILYNLFKLKKKVHLSLFYFVTSSCTSISKKIKSIYRKSFS